MTADPNVPVDDLWQRFHEVVNMTSRELVDWLGVHEELAPSPAQEAPPLGVAVLDILRKRRTDLTDSDLDTMWQVVALVEDETEGRTKDDLASDERALYRLCNVGHDPLRAE